MNNDEYELSKLKRRTTQDPQSTSSLCSSCFVRLEPFLDLLQRLHRATPGASTLRTERLTGPGDRHRQSHLHGGGSRWGSGGAARHWPKPAGIKCPSHGGKKWNWSFKLLDASATLLSFVGATKLKVLLTLRKLEYKAILKNTMTQVLPNLLKASQMWEALWPSNQNVLRERTQNSCNTAVNTHKFHSTKPEVTNKTSKRSTNAMATRRSFFKWLCRCISCMQNEKTINGPLTFHDIK